MPCNVRHAEPEIVTVKPKAAHLRNKHKLDSKNTDWILWNLIRCSLYALIYVLPVLEPSFPFPAVSTMQNLSSAVLKFLYGPTSVLGSRKKIPEMYTKSRINNSIHPLLPALQFRPGNKELKRLMGENLSSRRQKSRPILYSWRSVQKGFENTLDSF